MKAAHLAAARELADRLGADGRQEAEHVAARVRATGLASTLAWLQVGAEKNVGKRELHAALSERVGPLAGADTATLLAAYRETLALAEALHAVTRDKVAPPGRRR